MKMVKGLEEKLYFLCRKILRSSRFAQLKVEETSLWFSTFSWGEVEKQVWMSSLLWSRTRLKKKAWSLVRGGLHWTPGNILHAEGDWVLEHALQENRHSTKPDEIQERFGQCSQLMWHSAQGQVLDFDDIDGPFQSNIFHDYTTSVSFLLRIFRLQGNGVQQQFCSKCPWNTSLNEVPKCTYFLDLSVCILLV